MNVNDLCATSSDGNHPTETYSTSKLRNGVKEEPASTALTNTIYTTTLHDTLPPVVKEEQVSTALTNTATSHNTLPPLSQQHVPNRRLPSLLSLPTYDSAEDTTMNEAADTSDMLDMKKVIEKCSILCHTLAGYKTLQDRDHSNEDLEATFDYITNTTHDILDSLVAMEQQRETVVLNETEYNLIRQARNWKENRKPNYRRRSKRNVVGQRCHSCHTTETPEWRRGPDGARTLCNACGLHYSKLLRKESVTVSSCQLLTNRSSNSYTQLVERRPSNLHQIQAPHRPTHGSQQLHQQLQSPIPLLISTDASTTPPPSSSSTSNTTSSSSSSSSQPVTTSSPDPSLYRLTH